MKTPKELRVAEEQKREARSKLKAEFLPKSIEERVAEAIENGMMTSKGGTIDLTCCAQYWDHPDEVLQYFEKYHWTGRYAPETTKTYDPDFQEDGFVGRYDTVTRHVFILMPNY